MIQRRKLRIARLTQLIAAFGGAAVAGAIYSAERLHESLPCTASGGCDAVAASAWSHLTIGPLHDVPTALIGLGGYLILMALALWRLVDGEGEAPTTVASVALSGAAFVFSWYLQWIAHFVLEAFCVWCFTSAAIITVIFTASCCDLALLLQPAKGIHLEP